MEKDNEGHDLCRLYWKPLENEATQVCSVCRHFQSLKHQWRTRLMTPANFVAVVALTITAWQAWSAATDARAAEQSRAEANQTRTEVNEIEVRVSKQSVVATRAQEDVPKALKKAEDIEDTAIELAQASIDVSDAPASAISAGTPAMRGSFLRKRAVTADRLQARIKTLKAR